MPRKNTERIESDDALDITALLDRADEYLDKSEYLEAEALANEVLASSSLRKEDEARAHCIFASCCVNAGVYEEAESHYESAFKSAGSVSDLHLQSRALNGRAYMQGKICGDHTAALQTSEQALEFAVKAQDKKQQAYALDQIGVNLDPADYKLALEYLTRALALAEELGDKRAIAGVLCNIGISHSNKGDYRSALEYFSRALPLAEEADAKNFLANILNNIGVVYINLVEYHKALEFFQRALSIHEQTGTKQNIAGSLMCIGSVHFAIADYAQSLDYYSRALMLIQDAGGTLRMHLLNNIGNVHSMLSDYSRSLDYYSRALALAEEIGDKRLVAFILGNIGGVYFDLSDYPRALGVLGRSVDLSVQISSLRDAGFAMQLIAMTQSKLGNHDAAYQGLVDTLRHQREVLKSNEFVAAALLSLGGVLLALEKPEEGLARFEEALELANKFGEKQISLEAHKEIADVYSKMGDIAKENEHLKKHYALKEEIFSEESRKKVEAFNFRVAIANKERDAELARLKAEQAEQSLRLKERELANTASSLAAQTELLGDFRADLRKIVLRPDKYEPEEIIKQVRAKLKELPCEMIDFGKFEAQFATVHPEFRAKLETKYPDLTPQEVKICMLLHVNLQSAAIARLTCLSERSVEGHRFNIRKKMSLRTEDNLKDHLRTLEVN